MSIVATLDVPIRGETSNIDKAFERTEKRVKKFSDTIQEMSETTRNALAAATGGLSLVLAAGLKWGDSLGSIWTNLKDMAKKGADGIIELSKGAERLGISVRALGGLEYASGVDLDTLTTSLGKFQKGMGEAAVGAGEFAPLLNRLGIQIGDVQKLPLDQQIMKIADRFALVGNGADKAAIAVGLFGRGGLAMNQMLLKGGDGIEALMQKATELGFAVSGENAASVRAAAKAWGEYQKALTAIGRSLAVVIAPVLEVVNRGFANVGNFIARFVADNVPLMRQFTETVASVGKAFQEMAGEAFFAALGALENVGGKVGLNKKVWEDFRDSVLRVLYAVQYGAENWKTVLSLALTAGELGVVKFSRIAGEAFDEFALRVVQGIGEVATTLASKMKLFEDFAANMNKLAESISLPWSKIGKVLGTVVAAVTGNIALMKNLWGEKVEPPELKPLDPNAVLPDREKGKWEKALEERIKGHGKGDLERGLEDALKDKGDILKEDLGKFIERKMKEFNDKVARRHDKDPDVKGGESVNQVFGKVGAYEAGSKEAFSVMYGTQSAQQKALNVANDQLAVARNHFERTGDILAALKKAGIVRRGRA